MPVIAAFSAYSVGRNIETALAGCPSWIEVGEAIVLMKRSNNGRQLPAEVVEGRASPKGKQPTNGRGSDAEPRSTSIRLTAVRRTADGFDPSATTVDPREEPGALAAHAGICAGGEEQSSSLPRPSASIVCCSSEDGVTGRFQPLLKHSLEPLRCFVLSVGWTCVGGNFSVLSVVAAVWPLSHTRSGKRCRSSGSLASASAEHTRRRPSPQLDEALPQLDRQGRERQQVTVPALPLFVHIAIPRRQFWKR